jgi:hypothetical protein
MTVLWTNRHTFLTPTCPFRPMRQARPAGIVPPEGGGFIPSLMGGGRLGAMAGKDASG